MNQVHGWEISIWQNVSSIMINIKTQYNPIKIPTGTWKPILKLERKSGDHNDDNWIAE